MGKQGFVGYLKLDIMWQHAVAKLGKQILIMTWAVGTNQLVTHKFGRIGNYIMKQKTGNCRISTIDIMWWHRLSFELFFSFSFPGIMIGWLQTIIQIFRAINGWENCHGNYNDMLQTVTPKCATKYILLWNFFWKPFAMIICTYKYALTTATNMSKLQCTSNHEHECILAWTACLLKLCTYMFGWCYLEAVTICKRTMWHWLLSEFWTQ